MPLFNVFQRPLAVDEDIEMAAGQDQHEESRAQDVPSAPPYLHPQEPSSTTPADLSTVGRLGLGHPIRGHPLMAPLMNPLENQQPPQPPQTPTPGPSRTMTLEGTQSHGTSPSISPRRRNRMHRSPTPTIEKRVGFRNEGVSHSHIRRDGN